jgi:hypothetical protein
MPVTLDWLTGRSNVIDVLEMPEFKLKPLAKSAGKRRAK